MAAKAKKAGNMPQKKQDYVTNKVLIVFTICLLGVLGLMALTRMMDVGTTYAMGMTILRAAMIVSAICIAAGVVLVVRERKNGVDNTYRILTGRSLIVVAAVALVILALIGYYGVQVSKVFYVALPALAIYYLIYHSYQPEFVAIATDCGVAAFFLLLTRWIGGIWTWVGIVLAVVLAVVQLALVSGMKKKNGHLKLGERSYAFNFSQNAYLMLSITPVIMALLVVAALLGPTAGTYGLFGACGYAFVTAVYYTVKLM